MTAPFPQFLARLLPIVLLFPAASVAASKTMDQYPPLTYFGVKNLQLKAFDPEYLQTSDLVNTSSPTVHDVKKGDILKVSYGVRSVAWKKVTNDYEFSILIDDNTRSPLFKKVLDPNTSREHRGWQNIEFPLDRWEGRKVKIEFRTRVLGADDRPQLKARLEKAPVWGGLRIGSFARKPGDYNVILISLDTLRGDHLGYMGYSRNTSPNIDKLAENGVWFRQAIAQSPWTKPSHMSAFTALMPYRHGQTERITIDRGLKELDESIPTMPEILRAHGYLTQAFTGSGYVSARFGFSRGFDRYAEMPVLFKVEGPFIFEQGINFIEKNAARKFFLFLHTFDIHAPYKHRTFVEPGMKRKSEVLKAQYDSGILYVDGFIGKLKATLDRLKLTDNTIIILMSDHGEELWERGYDHGHGHTLYDDQLRIPLFFFNPTLLKPREVPLTQAQHIDILPTLLDLLKIDRSKIEMQGLSLIDAMNGAPPMTSVAISEAVEYGAMDLVSVRLQNGGMHKYIVSPSVAAGAPDLRDRTNKYWLNYVIPRGGKEFYDLVADPKERNDLIKNPPKIWKRLDDILRGHLRKAAGFLSGRATAEEGTAEIDPELAEKLRSLGY